MEIYFEDEEFKDKKTNKNSSGKGKKQSWIEKKYLKEVQNDSDQNE